MAVRPTLPPVPPLKVKPMKGTCRSPSRRQGLIYIIISWEVEVPQSEAPYPSSHL